MVSWAEVFRKRVEEEKAERRKESSDIQKSFWNDISIWEESCTSWIRKWSILENGARRESWKTDRYLSTCINSWNIKKENYSELEKIVLQIHPWVRNQGILWDGQISFRIIGFIYQQKKISISWASYNQILVQHENLRSTETALLYLYIIAPKTGPVNVKV